ncbi:unnamed protein product, partial [Closterium sp. NIES-65]
FQACLYTSLLFPLLFSPCALPPHTRGPSLALSVQHQGRMPPQKATSPGRVAVVPGPPDNPLLHTARPWQVSEGAAEAVVAAGANVLGAAEGVLRVAASGSDVRLFVKVVAGVPWSGHWAVLLFLYVTAAVGRIASLATIIFFCVISGFTVSLLRSLASSVAGLVNARTTM